MTSEKRAVEPYIVALDKNERDAYRSLRIGEPALDPATA
jgi:hypothetical protein